jgi:hypothetical protein
MKKKFLLFSAIFALLCFVVVAVYFIFFNVNINELAVQNVSEKGSSCYIANSGQASAKVYSGQREEPYVLDGKHNQMTDFTLIVFRTNQIGVDSPTFIIDINGEKYNGVLETNPYDGSFVSDLQIMVDNNATISLTVTVNDDSYNFEMQNVSGDWQISFDDAMDIGIQDLNSEISLCLNGKELNCELYVKAISDTNGNFDKFFYYVSYIDVNQNSNGVVIDVQTGEIIK